MTGCNNKRRFSLKYPDGAVERFGSCDPKEDDDRIVVHLAKFGAEGAGVFYLCHPNVSHIHGFDKRREIPHGTLWANGYYDHEHDGWKPLSEWV
jgi:hypothetical protein